MPMGSPPPAMNFSKSSMTFLTSCLTEGDSSVSAPSRMAKIFCSTSSSRAGTSSWSSYERVMASVQDEMMFLRVNLSLMMLR